MGAGQKSFPAHVSTWRTDNPNGDSRDDGTPVASFLLENLSIAREVNTRIGDPNMKNTIAAYVTVFCYSLLLAATCVQAQDDQENGRHCSLQTIKGSYGTLLTGHVRDFPDPGQNPIVIEVRTADASLFSALYHSAYPLIRRSHLVGSTRESVPTIVPPRNSK
jgi:hypothetical protein